MLTRDDAQKLSEKLIKLSTYPECNISINDTEQAYTRFANNGITTASFSRRRSVSISVTRDGQTGSYSLDELDDTSLSNAVKKAEELAAIAPPNPERLIPL